MTTINAKPAAEAGHAEGACDGPHFARPQREHEWLQRLVGDWTYEMDVPGEPGRKFTGTETVRSHGGLWITAEGRGRMPNGGETSSSLTIGYDPQKGCYVGTWIGSMMTHLWRYEGFLDASGRVLTLESEGPNFMKPGTTAKFRDIVEIISDDERIFRGTIQGEDGQWQEMMRMRHRRAGVGAGVGRSVRAIDLLRSALADEWFIGLAQELRGAPLTFPTPRGGNHPLWTVGHVALSEAEMMRIAFGGDNPLADWEPIFGRTSEPTDDAAAYPPFDEVVNRFREVRARTLRLLEETGEEGLSRAPHEKMEGVGHWSDSVGGVFHLAVVHMMSHHGQLADARRALGMGPRF